MTAATRPARPPLAIATLLLAGLAASAARAQPSVDETVRRVRALEREIAALLAVLPPRARAEAERWLASPEPEVDAPPAAALESAEAPEATEAPAASPNPVERPRGCPALAPLDTTGDGQISGADRFWRHLYLGFDQDGSTVSLFELGIRQVAVGLDTYTTAKDFVGDVDFRAEAVFHLVGRRRGPSRGALALDADGLRRAEGPSLVDAEGRPLEGIQRLRAGQALVDAGGVAHPIACVAAPPAP